MTYPVTSIKFWKAYGIHMRPYLLFLSGIAGISGMVIGLQDLDLKMSWLLAGLAFFLSYGFGQALTDCYQVDTDKLSASYRPLSQGLILIKNVKMVSIAGLTLCVLFLIIPNFRNLVFGLLSMFGLLTYSKVKRNYVYVGPFYNAWIVALLPVMGFLVTTEGKFADLLDGSLALLICLNLFAYANFVLIGYLKDITADRETGYRTFPVLFGWNNTVIVGTVISIICILISAFLIDWKWASSVLWFMGSALSLAGNLMAFLTNSKTESSAGIPIEMTVRSFLLWNMAAMVSIFPQLLIYLLIFYLIFEAVLYQRPEREQI